MIYYRIESVVRHVGCEDEEGGKMIYYRIESFSGSGVEVEAARRSDDLL